MEIFSLTAERERTSRKPIRGSSPWVPPSLSFFIPDAADVEFAFCLFREAYIAFYPKPRFSAQILMVWSNSVDLIMAAHSVQI